MCVWVQPLPTFTICIPTCVDYVVVVAALQHGYIGRRTYWWGAARCGKGGRCQQEGKEFLSMHDISKIDQRSNSLCGQLYVALR